MKQLEWWKKRDKESAQCERLKDESEWHRLRRSRKYDKDIQASSFVECVTSEMLSSSSLKITFTVGHSVRPFSRKRDTKKCEINKSFKFLLHCQQKDRKRTTP